MASSRVLLSSEVGSHQQQGLKGCIQYEEWVQTYRKSSRLEIQDARRREKQAITNNPKRYSPWDS